MKRILLTAAAVLVGAVAVVLLLAARKPDSFVVQRSTIINAPADRIFPLINDYRQWTAWSPYETKDPQMKRTFGPATAGKGATYAWDGDSKVGAGNMTIVESTPPSKVGIRLVMTKPIAADNDVSFTLTPQGADTSVTWAMQGTAPFFAKVIHVFFNMDKMVGGDMEAGLAKLKSAAERS